MIWIIGQYEPAVSTLNIHKFKLRLRKQVAGIFFMDLHENSWISRNETHLNPTLINSLNFKCLCIGKPEFDEKKDSIIVEIKI